jgi:pimeloyl-ACP methyl ester carboxylesterase
LVDARWLMKAIAIGVGAALVCGYLTLCLLFYVQQWQFVLHPPNAGMQAHSADAGTAAHLGYEAVAFDPSDAGQPQLHGWWIPASAAQPEAAVRGHKQRANAEARYSAVTLLYLHSGDESLATVMPQLAALHAAGANIFAFDYRGYENGYGRGPVPHPTERTMREDTKAAWIYVTRVRKTPATHVIVYGVGVGATLAAQLAAEHRRIPAAVLENPIFDVGAKVRSDPRTAIIPVRWLWRPTFNLERPLAMMTAPKLLFVSDDAHRPTSAQMAAIADPKAIVNLSGVAAAQAAEQRRQSLCSFMDEYLPETALRTR